MAVCLVQIYSLLIIFLLVLLLGAPTPAPGVGRQSGEDAVVMGIDRGLGWRPLVVIGLRFGSDRSECTDVIVRSKAV